MKTEPIEILKSDERGVIYKCGSINYIVRKSGTVSGDHTHGEEETLYLVEGKCELTIDEETQSMEAPSKVFIPKNVYHKLVALTDIKIIRA